MGLARLTIVAGLLLRLATTSPILTIPDSPLPTYDVIVVGGGPAGLSAASALGRVRRSALLIDSGVYRTDESRPLLVYQLLTKPPQEMDQRRRSMTSSQEMALSRLNSELLLKNRFPSTHLYP